MEIKLLGHDTKEKVISDLKERLADLEKKNGKGTKQELVELVQGFITETEADLNRDLALSIANCSIISVFSCHQ